jgi:hypothetical protein
MAPTNIYLDLTREFNAGRLRCILSSGQAVVLHQLAVMSKDGDWILREDEAAVAHVIGVLESHGARYRFGAPLDIRWLAGGWSAHLEFLHVPGGDPPLRVRTDFVTRPPRLLSVDLEQLWTQPPESPAAPGIPVVDVRRLAELKKTNRERDYAVIGELARRLEHPRDQLLLSRSARDLLELARTYPDLVAELMIQRPVLSQVGAGRDELEAALDAERRRLMHANEERLNTYSVVAQPWAAAWRSLENEMSGLPLRTAHGMMVNKARELLPTQPLSLPVG